MHPLVNRFLLALVFAATAAAQPPCPSRGITLLASGGRLGDGWRVDMAGPASVPGLLGLDLAPGPVATPIGTVCLGLSPALQVLAIQFAGNGAANFGGVLPPNGSLAGITVHAAAIAFDPAQPSGFAFSNGASFTSRQPRFWFVNPGSSTPFGTTPGAIAATNALTDDLVFALPLPTAVRDAATIPERGWLALLLADGTLAAFDGTTGSQVMNVALTGVPAQAGEVFAVPGGNELLLLAYGTAPSPFGGGTPGSLHVVSLPSGTVTTSLGLVSGNPDAMIHAPFTTLVFVRTQLGVVPIDFAAPFVYGAIPLSTNYGGLVDWQVAGGVLYCLHAGQAPSPFGGSGQPAAISAIDVVSLMVLTTNPLAMPVPAQMLRAGIGTTGPSLYVYGSAAAALEEFAQVSLTATASIPVGAGIVAIEPTTFGTQWLLLCGGAGCGGASLLSMPAGSTVVVTLTTLTPAPQTGLAVVSSQLLGKACVALGSNIAQPFATDPFAPATATTLPISAPQFRILAD
jgi:hypothetical protein